MAVFLEFGDRFGIAVGIGLLALATALVAPDILAGSVEIIRNGVAVTIESLTGVLP